MSKKSWGHRIYGLPSSFTRQCSSAGCNSPAEYSLSFYFQGRAGSLRHIRKTLTYCYLHTKHYALDHGLLIPGELTRVPLSQIATSELEALVSSIETELARRSLEKNEETCGNRVFSFSGYGVTERGPLSPYVARLYFKDEKIHRYFYTFSGKEVAGAWHICGEYCCRPGDVIESRERLDGVFLRTYELVLADEAINLPEEWLNTHIKDYLEKKIDLEKLVTLAQAIN